MNKCKKYNSKRNSKRVGVDAFFLRSVVLTLAMLTVIGCHATKGYDGPALPSSETATLRGYGVSLKRVNTIVLDDNVNEVVVPVGQNTIALTLNSSNYNMLRDTGDLYQLEVQVEAGKQYAITSQRGIGRLCAYEIESSTGQPDYHRSAGCLKPPSQESRQ